MLLLHLSCKCACVSVCLCVCVCVYVCVSAFMQLTLRNLCSHPLKSPCVVYAVYAFVAPHPPRCFLFCTLHGCQRTDLVQSRTANYWDLYGTTKVVVQISHKNKHQKVLVCVCVVCLCFLCVCVYVCVCVRVCVGGVSLNTANPGMGVCALASPRQCIWTSIKWGTCVYIYIYIYICVYMYIYGVYTVYIRHVNDQIYGHIRCIYTVSANPTHVGVTQLTWVFTPLALTQSKIAASCT